MFSLDFLKDVKDQKDIRDGARPLAATKGSTRTYSEGVKDQKDIRDGAPLAATNGIWRNAADGRHACAGECRRTEARNMKSTKV